MSEKAPEVAPETIELAFQRVRDAETIDELTAIVSNYGELIPNERLGEFDETVRARGEALQVKSVDDETKILPSADNQVMGVVRNIETQLKHSDTLTLDDVYKLRTELNEACKKTEEKISDSVWKERTRVLEILRELADKHLTQSVNGKEKTPERETIKARDIFNTAHGIKRPKLEVPPIQKEVENKIEDKNKELQIRARLSEIVKRINAGGDRLSDADAQDLLQALSKLEGNAWDLGHSPLESEIAGVRLRLREDAKERAARSVAREPDEVLPPITPPVETPPPAPEEPVIDIKNVKTARAEKSSELTQTELESIPIWAELSPGQRMLALENLKQVMLGLVLEKRQEKLDAQMAPRQNSKWHDMPTLQRAWYGMTRALQEGKLGKQALEEIEADTETKNKLLIEIAEGLKASCVDAKEVDGKLQILFAEDLKTQLPEEKHKIIDALNAHADAYSKIPYEWSLSSATKEQRRKSKLAQEYYWGALAETKSALGVTGSNLRLDSINERVYTQQLINNHPEIEEELARIKEPRFWRQVAEKGAYFGLGFARKSLVATATGALAVMAAPVLAGGMSGLLAGQRARKELRGKSIESRRGKADKIYSKEVMKTSKAKALSLGLEKLMTKVDYPFEKGGRVPAQKTRSLIASIDHISRSLENGLIDFGGKEERLKNQYHLLEALSRAKGLAYEIDLDITGELKDKLYGVHRKREDAIKKAQIKYINKKVLRGVALGTGAALLGQATRWFWPHTGAPSNISHSPNHPASHMNQPSVNTESAPAENNFNEPQTISQYKALTKAGEVESPAQELENVHFESVKEGGSLWRSAEHLSKTCRLSHREFLQAWSNPESKVMLPDGSIKHISEVWLTHSGDEVAYVPPEAGEKVGHFEFNQGSSIEHGLEVPHTNANLPDHHEATVTRVTEDHEVPVASPIETVLPFEETEMAKIPDLELSPKEYKVIRSLNVYTFLKQIPADENEAVKLFGNGEIRLRHEGIYEEREFMGHLRIAKYLRKMLVRKNGILSEELKRVRIGQMLKRIPK